MCVCVRACVCVCMCMGPYACMSYEDAGTREETLHPSFLSINKTTVTKCLAVKERRYYSPSPHTHRHKHTHTHTGSKTRRAANQVRLHSWPSRSCNGILAADSQAERETGREGDRQRGRQAEGGTLRQADRQADRQTEKQTGRQTER